MNLKKILFLILVISILAISACSEKKIRPIDTEDNNKKDNVDNDRNSLDEDSEIEDDLDKIKTIDTDLGLDENIEIDIEGFDNW